MWFIGGSRWFKVQGGSKWFKVQSGLRFKVVQGDFQGGRPAPPRSMPRPLLRPKVIFETTTALIICLMSGRLDGQKFN